MYTGKISFLGDSTMKNKIKVFAIGHIAEQQIFKKVK